MVALDQSVPAWINALTVVVLAIITASYAWSARKQAKAAESQAKAAMKQAEAAERQLNLLQSQIREQAGVALVALKENIKELEETAMHWHQRMVTWGQLTSQGTVELLPRQWHASLEHARRISPTLYDELSSIQRKSNRASLLIDQFTSKAPNYRSETDANEIQELLLEISNGCIAVSKKFEELG